MMQPGAYVIILLKSVVGGPSKIVGIFNPYMLVLNNLI